MHTYIGVLLSKIISVSNEVYGALKKRKNGKSFSETIKSLYEKSSKTPLDVIADWKPNESFVKSLENAFEGRKKLRLKRVGF